MIDLRNLEGVNPQIFDVYMQFVRQAERVAVSYMQLCKLDIETYKRIVGPSEVSAEIYESYRKLRERKEQLLGLYQGLASAQIVHFEAMFDTPKVN